MRKRSPIRRGVPASWVAAAMAVSALALSSATAAHAAPSRGEFDGTISVDFRYLDDETSSISPGSLAAYTEALHYEVHLTTRVQVYGFDTGSVSFVPVSGEPTRSASGTIRVASSPSLGYACSGGFSAKPPNAALPDIFLLPDQSGRRRFRVSTGPLNLEQIVATGTGKCSAPVTDGPQPAAWLAAVQRAAVVQRFAIPLPSSTVIDTISAPASSVTTHGDSKTAAVTAQLTISTNGTPAGAPLAGDARVRRVAKLNALRAIPPIASEALYPCLVASAGGGLLVGGTSTLITPVGPVGVPAAVIGAILAGVGGELCLSYQQTLKQLIDIAVDPPRSDYRRVARPSAVSGSLAGLPTCPPPGAITRSCAKIEHALAALDGANRRFESLAAATATTLARESGARAARDHAAVARQDRNLKRLNALWPGSRRSVRAARRALARAIRAAAYALRLSRAEDILAAASLTEGLQRRGASARAIQHFAGPALAPRTLDWLAQLAR